MISLMQRDVTRRGSQTYVQFDGLAQPRCCVVLAIEERSEFLQVLGHPALENLVKYRLLRVEVVVDRRSINTDTTTYFFHGCSIVGRSKQPGGHVEDRIAARVPMGSR